MEDFAAVYTRYRHAVHAYLLTLCQHEDLAEELTQETFFKALRALDSFDGRCPLNVWLCRIAKNTLYSYTRKHKREAPLPDGETTPSLPDPAPPPGAALESREGLLRIHRALHALPDPYREVFWLRAYGELSFADIAVLFNKTESWARVTYYRAKTKLKEALE